MLPPLLAALRDGTRDLHERTEAAFVLAAPGVTRTEYVAVLARLLAFYRAVERSLAPWGPALAPYELSPDERRKAPLLARDLRAVRALDPAAPAAAPAATELPFALPFELTSPAHAFGTLYVTEGATLGGQLLRRQLGPSLGLTPAHGLAFLSAYGPAVGPMWKAFVGALARFDAARPTDERAAAHADALAAARRTFEAFEHAVVLPTARPSLAALA